ncbi:5654_t:CDS:1, partial [Funneliformis caledonium]
ALSSIIVLNRFCLYLNYFTDKEWQLIIETNSYKIHELLVSASVSNALHNAIVKNSYGQDSFMHPDESPLSRASLRIFNEL